jgi:hypothetical protein
MHQTRTDSQGIAQLCLEEFSTLTDGREQMAANVRNFIRIIATKRVRERLLARWEASAASEGAITGHR